MVNYTTYPNITDVNFSSGPISTLWDYGATITGGLLSPALLFLIAAVSFMALREATPRGSHAVVGSSLVTFFSAFALMGAGLLHPFYFFAALGYLLVGLYLAKGNSPYG